MQVTIYFIVKLYVQKVFLGMITQSDLKKYKDFGRIVVVKFAKIMSNLHVKIIQET